MKFVPSSSGRPKMDSGGDQERHRHNRTVRREARRRREKSDLTNQYIFARLSGKVIRELVRLDVERAREQGTAAKKKWQPKKRGSASVQSDTAPPYNQVLSIVSGPTSRFHRALRSL